MLDEEFTSIFLPIHYFSTLIFNRKYNLTKKYVTSTKKIGVVYSMIGIAINIWLLSIVSKVSVKLFSYPYVYYTTIFMFWQCMISYCVVILLNLYHSNNFKRILLKLQSIDRHLPSRSNNLVLKKIVWVSCFALLFTYGVFITWKLTLNSIFLSWEKACFYSLEMIIDIELVYFTIIVYFLANKIKVWTRILNSRCVIENRNIIRNHFLRGMFAEYKSLLEALNLVNRSTQYTVFVYFVLSFIRILSFVQILIMWICYEHMNEELVTSRFISIALFIAKTTVLETVYCFMCEHLYRQVDSARVAVVLFGDRQEYKAVQRFVRNVCRYHNLHFNKFNCCGVFELNAKLPLHLTALTLSYVVVLLQFAFL